MRDRLPIILSTTALLVALFGATPLGEAAYNAVAPRNSVGTAQLKNNAITAAKLRKGAVTNAKLRGDAVTSGKVKNRSLRAIDFKLGQLPSGPPGPNGDKGDDGAKGAKGDPGAAGATTVTVRTAKQAAVQGVAANSTVVANAFCLAGERLLGGGIVVLFMPAANYRVIYSFPQDQAWSAAIYTTAADNDALVRTSAVCAAP